MVNVFNDYISSSMRMRDFGVKRIGGYKFMVISSLLLIGLIYLVGV